MPRRTVVRTLLLTAGLAVSLPALAPAAARADQQPRASCSPKVDLPHASGGAGGGIVKARATCSLAGVTDMLIAPTLYVCPSAPTATVSWLEVHCTVKGTGLGSFGPIKAGTTYTEYAPELGRPGAKGTGWWIGCANYEFTDSGGTSDRDVCGPSTGRTTF